MVLFQVLWPMFKSSNKYLLRNRTLEIYYNKASRIMWSSKNVTTAVETAVEGCRISTVRYTFYGCCPLVVLS